MNIKNNIQTDHLKNTRLCWVYMYTYTLYMYMYTQPERPTSVGPILVFSFHVAFKDRRNSTYVWLLNRPIPCDREREYIIYMYMYIVYICIAAYIHVEVGEGLLSTYISLTPSYVCNGEREGNEGESPCSSKHTHHRGNPWRETRRVHWCRDGVSSDSTHHVSQGSRRSTVEMHRRQRSTASGPENIM